MEFCDRLKFERTRLGYKSADFAVACGVSIQSQSLYETGKTVPKADYLQMACKLGADPAFLLTGTHLTAAASQVSEATRKPIEAFIGLPPKVQAAMLALVNATQNPDVD